MEIVAKARYVRMSPRKLRLLRDVVVGKEAKETIQVLGSVYKRGSQVIIKLLKSALANAKGRGSSEQSIWYVKNLVVDEGPSMKRFRAAAMGRSTIIKKRMSHVTVILEELETGKGK